MPEPDIRHGHAAGEADLAVDDDGAAMVPAVKTGELAELRHPEFLNFAAGRHECLEIFVGNLDAAETIQQHPDGNPFTLFLLQSGEQLVAEFTFRPDVDRKVDRPLRVLNGVEQAQGRTRRRCSTS